MLALCAAALPVAGRMSVSLRELLQDVGGRLEVDHLVLVLQQGDLPDAPHGLQGELRCSPVLPGVQVPGGDGARGRWLQQLTSWRCRH